MRSLNLRKLLVHATVASVIAVAGLFSVGNEALSVQAIEVRGTVTVTAGSLWTYSAPNWSARAEIVNSGAIFNISDKVSVDGREMYRLYSGMYITANPAYVSAQEVPVQVSTYKFATANLNMRTGAGTSYGVITVIPNGSKVEVLESSNGWDKVVYNGNTGFASSTYLSSEAQTSAPVPVTLYKAAKYNLNMRTGPGTGYARVLTIPAGGQVQVLETSNGWDKIVYGGYTGWASNEYLVEVSQSVTGTDVINFAKTLLGTPYTWGGDSPSKGFDCSGFTKYVYANFGIALPRVSGDQANYGTAVPLSEMRPGDLIYFGNGSVSHIGIYMGNNQMIHSPSAGKTVEIKDLTWHLNNYEIIGARRIIN
ncbi:MAG: NlpC/P60 family protein [Clostridiaceae bacterium]